MLEENDTENLRKQAMSAYYTATAEEGARKARKTTLNFLTDVQKTYIHLHNFYKKKEMKYQNNIPTDNESTRETHTQKADENCNVLFEDGLEDVKEHKSKLGKLKRCNRTQESSYMVWQGTIIENWGWGVIG